MPNLSNVGSWVPNFITKNDSSNTNVKSPQEVNMPYLGETPIYCTLRIK